MIVISKLAAAGGRMSLLRSRHWSGYRSSEKPTDFVNFGPQSHNFRNEKQVVKYLAAYPLEIALEGLRRDSEISILVDKEHPTRTTPGGRKSRADILLGTDDGKVLLVAEVNYQGPRKLSVDCLHARGLDQIFNSTNFSLLDSPFLAVTAVHSQASFTLQVNTVGPRYENLIRVETYDFCIKGDRIRWIKDWNHGGLLLPTAVGMIQKTKPTQPDYD